MNCKSGKYRTPGGGKQDYETDYEFFNIVNYEFQFGLDAAASIHNAKCSSFISEEQNALSKNIIWGTRSNGMPVWINPPYSRGIINEFFRKAWETSQDNCTVVVLAHTCLDTKYWDEWVFNKAAEIRHIKGRLRFWSLKPDKKGNYGNTSDLPHSLIIYRPNYIIPITHQISWNWKRTHLKYLGPIPVRDRKTKEIIKYSETV